MIENRPKYLDQIEFYSEFPQGYDMDVDYKHLPPLLNFDFHTLNGILPYTSSRFAFIGKNGTVNDQEGTVVFTNPLDEEYEYFKSIGVTEFQAISLMINFYAFKEVETKVLRGIPYSVSLQPMTKNNKIDTWHTDLLKHFDLEQLCQEGGYVMSGFDPFTGKHEGIGAHYSLFSKITKNDFSDSIGFQWGMYFLTPIFDKKEVQMHQNHTYSKQINSKYRKYKISNYFRSFSDIKPRRIWGCDSPIELFLIQGLYLRNYFPEIQYGIYRDGSEYPNYYKMAEEEVFLGEDKLITTADLFFQDKRLAIFCDGRSYHDADKDIRIDDKLKTLGIKSLRFSGKQITQELENVLDKIVKELE